MQNNKKRLICILVVIGVLLGSTIYLNKYFNSKEVKLPDYIKTELIEKENELNKQNFNFTFITDLHINNEGNSLNNINSFISVSNKSFIEFAAVGGDLYSAYNTTKEEGKKYLEQVSNYFSNINKEVFYTKGNHDCNAKLEKKEFFTNEFSKICLNLIKNEVFFNNEDEIKEYYYKDYEDEKIRVCVLNAFEGEGQEFIFNEEQLEFIANEMLDFSNKKDSHEWNVLFLTHTTNTTDKEKFDEILNAYQNGTEVNINNRTIKFNGQGNLIAVISGHEHIDRYDYDSGYLHIVCQRGFNTNEELNTVNEICFSIFSIDTSKKEIYEIRFGRGENRSWNYMEIEEIAA